MGNFSDACRRLSEPDDRDLAPDPQREDERIREQRWTAFVTFMREQARAGVHLTGLTFGGWVLDVGTRREELRGAVDDFAESEGWPATLRALARAMEEQQAEAAEIERRR